MSSTSSAAATLTRPRIAVAVVSAVAAASAGYYCFVQYRQPRPDTAAGGASLHRSNALRRSRRRSLLQDDLSDNDAPPGDESTALVPLGGTDGHTDDQDWYNDPSQSPRQRSGENIVTLLFRVSEDNARRNAYVHRGCQCNGCGMVPIRGIRYRCANCADFDLCEACESQSLHYRTHVFYKVRVPAPPFGPRQVQPAWYPGDPDTAPRTLPRHLLAKWSNETGFERVELDAFWEQWTFIANTEWRDDPTGLCLAMDRKTFERCLVPSGGYKHAAPNLIHDRMFAFYDTNNDDLIGFEEFLHGVSYRKRKDKLARTFEGYDIDGDGYVCRKDFLRMFRAYYVLYKQMHRDILEGLDDYMMSTTEAQQLVNGRAPLSSLFGREGRVPGGDHSRPQEGKVFRSNGEVDVHDGKGVVNKDKPDTAGREEILSGLFSRHNQSAFTESFGTTSRRARSPNNESSRYWTGLLNPPQNVAELTSLVNGEVNIDDILSSLRNQDSTSHALETQSASSDDQERPTTAENADSDMMNSLNTARYARRSDTNRFTTTLAPEGQLRTQHHTTVGSSRLSQERRKRIQVRKQLLERWKRRQFYLDEEEGGLPPQGWKETEDILEDLTNAAGPSQEPQMLSSRSRSSSKVRFADDDDDLDTRSNPSTSSRSIPERWGGMEIPDAERDAGKEILYQVTQQAFNELLDDIFKRKEDLAVQCAQTKDERNKYRHLFENIQLEAVSTTPPDENAPRGNGPVQQQSLEELLTVSGYTVDPAALRARSPVEPASEDAAHNAPNNRDIETPAVQPATTTEPTNIDTPATYRDPTMPQFRPNTESDSVSTAPAQQDSTCSESSSLVAANVPRGQPTARTQSGDSSDSHAEPAHIPHSTLVTWKRLDVAEAEARARGGWGKLNFEEFEDIYREHELHENNRNRLDYLGSWIDFCIP